MGTTAQPPARRNVLQLVGLSSAAAGLLAATPAAEAAPQTTAHRPARKDSPMQHTPTQPTTKGTPNWFTGDVYITPIKEADAESPVLASRVRFTPGGHTHWHSHPNGQTLHVTEGIGLVASRDGTVIRMEAGDTVWTPPGVEHWHGGTEEDFMCHLAIVQATEEGQNTIWLEPVSPKDYRRANRKANKG
jgi:quercetin dioxygenase-like cupin family protein